MQKDIFTLKVTSLYACKTAGANGVPVSEIHLHPEYGIATDIHAGKTRVRSTGETVPNFRHFTAVHAGELGKVADAFGVPFIDPAWINANICFSCPEMEKFTEMLVAGTELLDAKGRPVLVIKGITEPCLTAGRRVAAKMSDLSVDARSFPKVAHNRRGVYGMSLVDVIIKIHDTFTVMLS